MYSNIKRTQVHISTIQVGDTVEHDGYIRTVGKNNLKHCSLMGTSLWGDSYKIGRNKVTKISFTTK